MRAAIFGSTVMALCAVALCLLWPSGAPAAAQEFPDDVFTWRTDLDAAREEAREKGRPLLVVFR